MSKNSVRYIDLDSVKPEIELTVKLGGKTHQMVPLTVDGFIENFRLIEQPKKTVEEQMEALMAVILRAFPSITRGDLGVLTLDQLTQLRDHVTQANGQRASEDEVAADKAGDANPQNAG